MEKNNKGGWGLGQETGQNITAAAEAIANLWLMSECLSVEIAHDLYNRFGTNIYGTRQASRANGSNGH